MKISTDEKKKTLPHIACSAYTCEYNNGSKGCCAKDIDVNASNAVSAEETACSTFKLK